MPLRENEKRSGGITNGARMRSAFTNGHELMATSITSALISVRQRRSVVLKRRRMICHQACDETRRGGTLAARGGRAGRPSAAGVPPLPGIRSNEGVFWLSPDVHATAFATRGHRGLRLAWVMGSIARFGQVLRRRCAPPLDDTPKRKISADQRRSVVPVQSLYVSA